MKRTYQYIFTCLVLVFTLLWNHSSLYAFPDEKIYKAPSSTWHVLFLSSYYRQFKWTEDILHGLHESFANQPIELTTDFLDAEREFDPEYEEAIIKLLKIKYHKKNYDLVITSGTDATFFFINHGRQIEIFKDIPHVFCGTNALNKTIINDQNSGTGITARMDLYHNIELINSLHPYCKRIIIIADNTNPGKSIQSQVNQIIDYRSTDLSIEIWNDFSIRELKKDLLKLKKDTIVLYGVLHRDKNNVYINHNDSVEMVTQFSPVPVYGTHDSALGSGIVGGYLINGTYQGKIAGTLALQILNDKKSAKNIPLVIGTKGQPEFDWRALSAFKIPTKNLPAGSKIYFTPKSFYHKYKKYKKRILVAACIFLSLSGLCIVVFMLAFARTRKSEKALMLSTNELTTFLNSAEEAIITIDSENRVLRLNPVAEKMTGWSQDEANNLGINEVLNIFDPESRMPIENIFDIPSDSKDTPALLRRKLLISRTNKEYHIAYSINFVEDSNTPHRVVLLFRDITEEYALFERSRKKEFLHRTIFEKTSNGILLIQKISGFCIDANQAAADIIDIPVKEIKTLHIQSISPALTNKWKAASAVTDQPVDLNQIIYHTKSKRRKILNVIIIDIDESSMAVLIQDITQHLEMEKQIRQSQKIEALGTLAGGIAHDFNNILTSLFAYTALLEINGQEDSELFKKSLGQIDNGLQRATELVRQILTFSRQNEAQKIHFNIHHVIKEALKFLRSSIPASIELETEINTKSKILGDPTQIHQIVMNLCVNAYHSMKEKDQGTLTIKLDNVKTDNSQTSEQKEHIRLIVADTGTGMPEDVMAKIFDPFFTTKAVGEGTGLGLSVVDGIVKNHNGKIKVSSQKDQGSQFEICFPIAENYASGDQTTTIEQSSLLSHLKVQILLVDDEKEILLPIKAILDQNGFPTTTAENPTLALEIFKANPEDFNLVILDLVMPNMNGLQLAEAIKAIRPNVKIIMCTGFVDPDNNAKARKKGISTILEKPVSPKDLLYNVQKLLSLDNDQF